MALMTVKFRCGHTAQIHPDRHRGKVVCPTCGNAIRMSQSTPAPTIRVTGMSGAKSPVASQEAL